MLSNQERDKILNLCNDLCVNLNDYKVIANKYKLPPEASYEYKYLHNMLLISADIGAYAFNRAVKEIQLYTMKKVKKFPRADEPQVAVPQWAGYLVQPALAAQPALEAAPALGDEQEPINEIPF